MQSMGRKEEVVDGRKTSPVPTRDQASSSRCKYLSVGHGLSKHKCVIQLEGKISKAGSLERMH